MALHDSCLVTSVAELSPFSPILVNLEFGPHCGNNENNLTNGIYVDKQDKNLKTVIIEKGEQKFVGTVNASSLSQTLILLRNKKNNEGRIFATQSCSLHDSKREEEKYKRKLSKDDTNATETSKDYLMEKHTLLQTFGSKKSKRASGLALKLNRDLHTNKEKIMTVVADVDIKASELKTTDPGADDLLKLLPPCNRSARSPGDVYKVEDLLTAEEIDSLRPAAQLLKTNPPSEADEKSNFFLFAFYKLIGDRNDEDKMCLLIYGNSLVKFFNMLASDLKRSDILTKICPQSKNVGSKILTEFTVKANNVRTRPLYCKDKIVCYLLALVVLICGYQVNIETISSCLKGLGQKKLLQLSRVVGLTVERGSKIHKLKIPLPPLPQVRTPRQKR